MNGQRQKKQTKKLLMLPAKQQAPLVTRDYVKV
jgi:hypothetical protein